MAVLDGHRWHYGEQPGVVVLETPFRLSVAVDGVRRTYGWQRPPSAVRKAAVRLALEGRWVELDTLIRLLRVGV